MKNINIDEIINIEKLEDNEDYNFCFKSPGRFMKEVNSILGNNGEPLSVTISRCLSFCRMCKEIEDKSGELRFKLNNKTYKMMFPK